MLTSEQRRETMIASQLRVSRVSDDRVIAAIRAVPRERFVPPSREAFAYIDEDIEIAPGRYLMEPMVFGRLLVNAEIRPNDRVLVVGSGTGYAAVVIAQLAGVVVALEEQAELAAKAESLIAALAPGAVSPVTGPLNAGWAAEAPYDLIFIDGAVGHIPPALVDQLADNGRLAGVLIEEGIGRGVIGRKSGSGFGTNPFMDAHVARLPGFDAPRTFTF
jgi:protein-L-isoaspartate(D-aspartate) O-methyltransferase